MEGPPLAVSAGFAPGPAAGILFGHDLYARWSGEIRYLFEVRDSRLTSPGASANFAGQAHVLEYDVLFHLRSRESRMRPYAALGAGMKFFRGTGAEVAWRPLMQYAYLTHTNELKPMLSVGGGLKFRLSGRIVLRLDFRDQLTRFPRKIIAPAPQMLLGGWLNDFVPTVGLSWMF